MTSELVTLLATKPNAKVRSIGANGIIGASWWAGEELADGIPPKGFRKRS
jgi:hypothetical protein